MEKYGTIIAVSTGSISLTTLFALTHEIQYTLYILGILIMIDFLTGVIKSYIQKETSSDGMARGLIRKSALIVIPLTVIIAGNGIDLDLTNIINWILSALILSEAYSIVANCYTINTGKKAKEYDVLSMIIHRLGNFIDTFLKK